MICINSENTDPYFNLAAEEYLLKKSTENIFMLWCSKPSVIVGKHQNALGEINYRYVNEHNILVARRLSGGGTVYHDGGNLNFTFIINGEKGKLVDFKKFVTPIMNILLDMGLKVHYGERNDLFIEDKKISGNAEHVYKTRTLHHGTLLLNANLHHLRNAIQVVPGKYTDRAVKSVRSSVANIIDYLRPNINMPTFKQTILESFINQNKISRLENFTIEEKRAIDQLVKEKYNTWPWTYGYSPKYTFNNTVNINNIDVKIKLFVEKGIITEAEITSEGEFQKALLALAKTLINKPHKENILHEEIKKADQFSGPLTKIVLLGFF